MQHKPRGKSNPNTKVDSKKSQRKKRGDSLFDNLKEFKPLTENQDVVNQAWLQGKNLCITGYAGTGKTYLALYHAIKSYIDGDSDRIYIFRSAVQSRDIGFLPGTEAEKMEAYEKPYIAIVNQLLGRDDAYGILKKNHVIDFQSTSFLRGITLDNACVIVDEAQNLDDGEINTIMTRLGKKTRIFVCGDIRQSDIAFHKSGICFMQKVLTKMPKWFTIVEMEQCDIVRSGLVKDWIIASEAMKL